MRQEDTPDTYNDDEEDARRNQKAHRNLTAARKAQR